MIVLTIAVGTSLIVIALKFAAAMTFVCTRFAHCPLPRLTSAPSSRQAAAR